MKTPPLLPPRKSSPTTMLVTRAKPWAEDVNERLDEDAGRALPDDYPAAARREDGKLHAALVRSGRKRLVVQFSDSVGAAEAAQAASQPLHAKLTALAGLAVADGNFAVGDGSTWVAESGATARTSLGLGSMATQNANAVAIGGGTVSGITDLAVVDGGTGASDGANARTNLGLGTIAVAAQIGAQADSTAATLAALVADFNALKALMRASGAQET